MKTKKLIYAFLGIMYMVGLYSCTDLDEEIYSSISADQFFNNEREMIMNAGRAYAHLRGGTTSLWGEFGVKTVSSDEAIIPFRETNLWWDGGVWIDLHRHNFSSQNPIINDAWNLIFNGISICNQIIYQNNESPVDFDGKDRITAEIILLRAYLYYIGLDMFGNIPISTDFLDTSLPIQSNRKQVFDFIESEILSVIDLVDPYPTQSNYGRTNQAMGYALLAQMYLNAQEWIGESKWQQAIDAADMVINMGHFALADNYFSNFEPQNQNSPENIFVVPYDRTMTTGWYNNFIMHCFTLHTLSQQTFGIIEFTWDGICAMEEFYYLYDENDKRINSWLEGPQFSMSGEPLMLSPTRQLTYRPYVHSLHEPSDPALLDDGVRFQKYMYEPGILPNQSMSNDWVVFRYADVLMVKAEALMRQNGGAATQEAVDIVNMIRARSFEDDSHEYTTATLTMEEMLNEMGREFAWENRRRRDLIRFGEWTKPWFEKPAGGDHLKLFPIPIRALDVNPNLSQNPGY